MYFNSMPRWSTVKLNVISKKVLMFKTAKWQVQKNTVSKRDSYTLQKA